MKNLIQQSKDRQIRVFISSTFRDMQEERDFLVKKIFPQLRKICEERAVTWTEVDLRWGITDEQKSEGKVLPLCLEEIHRCRPYFIGLLGERYGWVPDPDSIPPDLLESNPWLKHHLSNSVTELEIQHGVFCEKPMHGHAYFYFRDPKYLDLVPVETRQDFAAESGNAKVMLAKLKQKIRDAHDKKVCELRENYSTPEQLGEWILEDLTNLLNRLFPMDKTPNPLDQEAARHEAYARSRRLAFVGRDDILRRLNEHAEMSIKPIVLTGKSGCGKSALLAEWAARWHRDHPNDIIIQHYIGSTPDSADCLAMVRRILNELKRAFAINAEIPVKPDSLRVALLDWTIKVTGSRKVILVLDALNQLADDVPSQQLGWLPIVFPTNFYVIISTLPGDTLEVIRKRGWPEIPVPLFARTDIAPASIAYFDIFSKTPPHDLLAKLESTPAACNALYLRAVLDELRQFGRHDDLNAKADEYLSSPDLPALFEHILNRWHDDFDKDPDYPDIVQRSLCLIACARFGLKESELLDLLGKNRKAIPHRLWTAFYLAAENSLTFRAGVLNFGHGHIRDAVQQKWLLKEPRTRHLRLQLADYFDQSVDPNDRQVKELPYLLRHAGEHDRLRACLLDINRLPSFVEHEEQELIGFWLWLDEMPNVGKYYLESFDNWLPWAYGLQNDLVIIRTIQLLTKFLIDIGGSLSSVEMLLQNSLKLVQQKFGLENQVAASILSDLGSVMTQANRLSEAEATIRKALEITEKVCGFQDTRTAITLNNLGELQRRQRKYCEAEALFRRSLKITETELGKQHPDIAIRLNNLGLVYLETNRLDEADFAFRKSLAIFEINFGLHHPNLCLPLVNLSLVLHNLGLNDEAEKMLRRSLDINEQSFGLDHPKVEADLNDLANLIESIGRYHDAETILLRSFGISKKQGANGVIQTIAILRKLASLHEKTGRLEDEESYCRQALNEAKQNLEDDHEVMPTILEDLAWVLRRQDRLSEALAYSQQRIQLLLQATLRSHQQHPMIDNAIEQHVDILIRMGMSKTQILSYYKEFAPEIILTIE